MVRTSPTHLALPGLVGAELPELGLELPAALPSRDPDRQHGQQLGRLCRGVRPGR